MTRATSLPPSMKLPAAPYEVVQPQYKLSGECQDSCQMTFKENEQYLKKNKTIKRHERTLFVTILCLQPRPLLLTCQVCVLPLATSYLACVLHESMEKTQDLGYILIVSPKPTKPVSIAFFTARCQFGMEAQPASHNYLLFFAFADIAEATSKWRTAMQWIAATKPAPKRLSSHRCTAKTQVLYWLDNRWFHVCWGNLFLCD